MNSRQFLQQLSLVTLLTVVAVEILALLPIFAEHRVFAWIGVLLFAVITVAMFLTGQWGVQHENKNTFISLMYVYMGGKMLLSVFTIALYYLYTEPKSNLFILPFFFVYFVYTIFESYCLTKLNQKRS